MRPTDIRKLFDHLAWADGKVLAALRTSPGSDPRAAKIFAHVLGAEHVWLARVRQQPAPVAVWPTLTPSQLAELAAVNQREYGALLASLTDEQLAGEIDYANSAGQRFRSTLADILVHVALHGCYHRGQVALVMREGGGEPAPTDYIGFVRGVPAATTRSRGNA